VWYWKHLYTGNNTFLLESHFHIVTMDTKLRFILVFATCHVMCMLIVGMLIYDYKFYIKTE